MCPIIPIGQTKTTQKLPKRFNPIQIKQNITTLYDKVDHKDTNFVELK